MPAGTSLTTSLLLSTEIVTASKKSDLFQSFLKIGVKIRLHRYPNSKAIAKIPKVHSFQVLHIMFFTTGTHHQLATGLEGTGC